MRDARAPSSPHELEQAERAARLVARSHGWLWPRWLGLRLDETSGAAGTSGPLGVVVNDAHRRWTSVGVLDGPGVASVDPAGLVSPAGASWALDWWIGADDRWHLPAREAAVRQHVEGPGVVETAVRVPGGDAVQRVYGVRLPAESGTGAVLVVEVENRSAVPFALALALRPATVEQVGRIDAVAVDDRGLLIDGVRAVLLAKRPGRATASSFAGGDVAALVLAGAAGEGFTSVEDPQGMAQAVAIVPVAHRTTVRAVLPLVWTAAVGGGGAAVEQDVGTGGGWRRRGLGRRSRPTPHSRALLPESFPGGLPEATQVGAGWAAHLARGLRGELADPTLHRVRRSALARVVLAATSDAALDDLLVPAGAVGLATVIEALASSGFGEEATHLLVAWFDEQRPDGSLPGVLLPSHDVVAVRDDAGNGDGDGAATAVALWALWRHWSLCRDRKLVDATVRAVLDAVRSLLATADAAPDLVDPSQRVDPPQRGAASMWRRAALEVAGELLTVAGDSRNARAVSAAVARTATGSATGSETGRGSRGSTPQARVTVTLDEAPGLVRTAALLIPGGNLKKLDAQSDTNRDELRVEGALRAVWGSAGRPGSSVEGMPVPQPGAGGDPALGFAAVVLGAAGGDVAATDRLRQLVRHAAPTGSWPTRIHPRTGEGCSGSGDDAVVAAAAVLALRALLVAERPGGLDLCPVFDPSWRGVPVEAHEVPTRHGTVSFAIRWHGKRPALLWELVSSEDEAPDLRPVLRIPGLDPNWASTELRGDTLLAEPPEPATAPPVPTEPQASVTASPVPAAAELPEAVLPLPTIRSARQRSLKEP